MMEEKIKNKIKGRMPSILDLRKFSPRIFEHFCSIIIEDLGYENIKITNYKNDSGYDIEAYKNNKKILIECKRRNKNNVGVIPVSRLVETCYRKKAEKGIFITTGYFTKKVFEEQLERSIKIEFWDCRKLINKIIKAVDLRFNLNNNQIKKYLDLNKIIYKELKSKKSIKNEKPNKVNNNMRYIRNVKLIKKNISYFEYDVLDYIYVNGKCTIKNVYNYLSELGIRTTEKFCKQIINKLKVDDYISKVGTSYYKINNNINMKEIRFILNR